MVYDSKLHLFSRKFKSRWFGPCIIKKNLGNGAFEVQSPSAGIFKVNGQRMKHYFAGEKIEDEDTDELEDEEQEDAPNASSPAGGQ